MSARTACGPQGAFAGESKYLRHLLAHWLAMEGGHETGHSRPPKGGPGGAGRGEFGWSRGFPRGPFGPGGGRGRHRKARRGDVRTAALLLLADGPLNGYQIMQEVAERSGGLWNPSPGSVYPTLSQLEDEGLIRSEEFDGRRQYRISDAGRELLAKRDPEAGAPWDQQGPEGAQDTARALAQTTREVAMAMAQVARSGSSGQIGAAQKVLVTARRELYRILADGEDAGEEPSV